MPPTAQISPPPLDICYAKHEWLVGTKVELNRETLIHIALTTVATVRTGKTESQFRGIFVCSLLGPRRDKKPSEKERSREVLPGSLLTKWIFCSVLGVNA